MVRELTGINPHCDRNDRCDPADRIAKSDDDRMSHYLDRMFVQWAAEPISPSLKKMLIDNKLLLPHR
jgi:hypothetical protein